MSGAWPRIRAVALLSAGAIGVHELRYVAGYGGSADEALAEQGHSYMSMVLALTVLLLGLTAVRFAASAIRASRGELPVRRAPRLTASWASFAGALASIYVLQEGFEGSYSAGHPSGLVGIFGHGGWTALIFAALIGAVLAVITRIAHGAIEQIARYAARRTRGKPAPAPRPALLHLPAFRSRVLAWNLAGRAPPRV
jgi:hypothetical protein